MKSSTKYLEFKKQYKELKEEVNKVAKTAFRELADEVFENNPDLVSFSWTQYTPYFNDGETCVFSANTGYPEYTYKNSEGETVSYDENYGDGDGEVNEKLEKDITNFLEKFDEEDYESLFGDHCKVIVTKTKIEVEEFDHD